MARREPALTPLDDNLVGYLLGVLDEPARRETEAQLLTNPEARRKLDLLRRALAPLESSRDDAEPSAGLAERTLAFVARHHEAKLPPAPSIPVGQAGARGWWRRADVLAASVLLFILLGVAAGWLMNSRHRADIIACQDNMRRLHAALMQYADQREDGLFPRVEAQGPRAFAGIFIPVLADAGLLTGDVSITCPASDKRTPPPEPGQLRRLEEWFLNDRPRFEKAVADLAGSYAYALGYRDRAGLHGLHRGEGMDRMPILADCSPYMNTGADGGGNSCEHAGKGQNVLSVDGAVRFITSRFVAGDDIYLNDDRLISFGVHDRDSVLADSP